MSDYWKRKLDRVLEFERRRGVKFIKCGACNGSGYYDHNGSPPCGSCGGTGREQTLNDVKVIDLGRGQYRVETVDKPSPLTWRETLEMKTNRKKRKRALQELGANTK